MGCWVAAAPDRTADARAIAAMAALLGPRSAGAGQAPSGERPPLGHSSAFAGLGEAYGTLWQARDPGVIGRTPLRSLGQCMCMAGPRRSAVD